MVQEVSQNQPDQPRIGGGVADHCDALVRLLQINGAGWNASSPRAIGVTSCDRRQGVSTLTARLAVSAATLTRGRVLLVDANVHHSGLLHAFAVSATDPGLENILAGECDVFDGVRDSTCPNLSFMPPGSPDGRKLACEVDVVAELLDSLKHVFRLIVFDLPVANEFSNCYAIAQQLDGVMLVIDPRRTRRVQAQSVCRQLDRVGVTRLGVILNRCRDKF